MKFKKLQFDEMESFERSKCLPLSIPLVVVPKTRKILAIQACSMPAKGLLAEISRKKYGFRKDERPQTAVRLLRSIQDLLDPEAQILTDQNPKYPSWLRRSLPTTIEHQTVKGRRGCVVGQGELKRGGFDPLFSLNHTCAMIRDNIKRLSRRTWCTTKRVARLNMLLMIYVDHHNSELTA